MRKNSSFLFSISNYNWPRLSMGTSSVSLFLLFFSKFKHHMGMGCSASCKSVIHIYSQNYSRTRITLVTAYLSSNTWKARSDYYPRDNCSQNNNAIILYYSFSLTVGHFGCQLTSKNGIHVCVCVSSLKEQYVSSVIFGENNSWNALMLSLFY